MGAARAIQPLPGFGSTISAMRSADGAAKQALKPRSLDGGRGLAAAIT